MTLADRLTPEEVEKRRKENEAIEAEFKDLQGATLAFMAAFAHLENALGAVLYEIINIDPRTSHIAYAIYFSPTGFEARQAIVGNALMRYVEEHSVFSFTDVGCLRDVWKETSSLIEKIRKWRNAIAHGTAQRLDVSGKTYVRLASPAFDVIRVWRELQDGKIPGIAADALWKIVKKCEGAERCIIDLSVLIDEHRDGSPLREKCLELVTRLKAVSSQ